MGSSVSEAEIFLGLISPNFVQDVRILPNLGGLNDRRGWTAHRRDWSGVGRGLFISAGFHSCGGFHIWRMWSAGTATRTPYIVRAVRGALFPSGGEILREKYSQRGARWHGISVSMRLAKLTA
jgi:hypothetical protein